MRRGLVLFGRSRVRSPLGVVAHQVAMIQAAKENPRVRALEWLDRERVSIDTPQIPEVSPIRIPAPAFFTQHEELTLGAAAGKAFNEHRGLADYANQEGISSESEFLVHVIERGSLEAVRTMLYRGNFKRAINNRDQFTNLTPLEVAIKKYIDNPGSMDFRKMVDWLLEDGADPNIETKDSDTLLSMVLRESQSYRLTKILLENGADPNAFDKEGKLPLAHVITDFDLTELLMRHGSLILSKIFLVKDEDRLSDTEQEKIKRTSGVMMNILRDGHGAKNLPFLYQKQVRQCLEYGLELANEETYQGLINSRYDNVRDLNNIMKVLKDGICLKHYEMLYYEQSKERLDEELDRERDRERDLEFITKYVDYGCFSDALDNVRLAISVYAAKLKPSQSPSSPKGNNSGNSPDDPSRVP